MADRQCALSEVEKGMADTLETENKDEVKAEIVMETQGKDNPTFVGDEGAVDTSGSDESVFVVTHISENPSRRLATFKRMPTKKTSRQETTEVIIETHMARPRPPIPPQISAERLATLRRSPSGRTEESDPANDPQIQPYVPPTNLDVIEIIEPGAAATPTRSSSVRVSYCPQPRPKWSLFRRNSLHIDLSSPPIELPENSEINRGCRPRCIKITRWVQAICIVSAIIVILVLYFIPRSEKK